jgi:hypothetical protein
MVALGRLPILSENMESGTGRFLCRFKGEKGTLILFICNHPLLHVIEEVVMISNDYKVQGLGVVAISVTMQ